jgi:hypothetical protein
VTALPSARRGGRLRGAGGNSIHRTLADRGRAAVGRSARGRERSSSASRRPMESLAVCALAGPLDS